MRPILSALLIAALVAGCASNPSAIPSTAFTLPTVTVNALPHTLRDAISTQPLAYLRGEPIVPILQLPKIETNHGTAGIVLWGTHDASTHAIEQITEAQIFGMGTPPGSVHVFFNRAMQPVLFRDDASGYSLKIEHLTDSVQRVTLCDPSFSALQAVTVTRQSGGNAHVGPVTEGGSCTIRKADAIRANAHNLPGCKGNPASIAYQLCKLAPLITAGSYVGGLGFAIGAIMKFRQHKDNPTQQPISVPIALLFIAAALIFIPSVFRSIEKTIFGDPDAVGGVDPVYVPQESLPGCSGTAPAGNCPFPHPEPTPS